MPDPKGRLKFKVLAMVSHAALASKVPVKETTTARTRRSRNFREVFASFREVFASFSEFSWVRQRVWTCSGLPGCVRMSSDAFGSVRTVAFVPYTGEATGAENLRNVRSQAV